MLSRAIYEATLVPILVNHKVGIAATICEALEPADQSPCMLTRPVYINA